MMSKRERRARGQSGRAGGRVACGRGFTMVELLVVIAIIAALAVLIFAVASRAIRKAEGVKCLGQIRELTTGLTAFSADYQRPPLPESKRVTGWDTIYGDPGGLYSTQYLVAVLGGKTGQFATGTDEIFDASKDNKKGETYWEPGLVDDRKAGVGRKDGKFYDPWGREMMVAINTPPYRRESSGGQYDSLLMTWGLAEYTDTKPRDQEFVIWSYGKDGKKAVAAAGSDDVISW